MLNLLLPLLICCYCCCYHQTQSTGGDCHPRKRHRRVALNWIDGFEQWSQRCCAVVGFNHAGRGGDQLHPTAHFTLNALIYSAFLPKSSARRSSRALRFVGKSRLPSRGAVPCSEKKKTLSSFRLYLYLYLYLYLHLYLYQLKFKFSILNLKLILKFFSS